MNTSRTIYLSRVRTPGGSTINEDSEFIQLAAAPSYRTNDNAPPLYIAPGNVDRATRLHSLVENWRETIPRLGTPSTDHSNGYDERLNSYTTGETSRETLSPVEPRYVYYRVYMGNGAIQLENPVYQEDQTLGRIAATSVPPPHTVKSLIRLITRVEGVTGVTKCELFLDLTCLEPIEEGPLLILGKDGPGCTPERALAFVYSVKSPPTLRIPSPTKHVRSPTPLSRPPGPLGRPPTPLVRSSADNAKFHKRLIATQDCDNSSINPNFLSFRRGDVLDALSKSRWEIFSGNGGGRTAAQKFKVYEAVDSDGSRGFVMKNAVRLRP